MDNQGFWTEVSGLCIPWIIFCAWDVSAGHRFFCYLVMISEVGEDCGELEGRGPSFLPLLEVFTVTSSLSPAGP